MAKWNAVGEKERRIVLMGIGHKPISEIAKEINRPANTVYRIIKSMGFLPNQGAYTMKALCEEIGYSDTTVKEAMKVIGIRPRRSAPETRGGGKYLITASDRDRIVDYLLEHHTLNAPFEHPDTRKAELILSRQQLDTLVWIHRLGRASYKHRIRHKESALHLVKLQLVTETEKRFLVTERGLGAITVLGLRYYSDRRMQDAGHTRTEV